MKRQIVTVPTVLEQKLVGTPITRSFMETRAAVQWFTLQTESIRKVIVSSIPGCIAYGSVVNWERLPERAKTAVFDAYAVHCCEIIQHDGKDAHLTETETDPANKTEFTYCSRCEDWFKPLSKLSR